MRNIKGFSGLVAIGTEVRRRIGFAAIVLTAVLAVGLTYSVSESRADEAFKRAQMRIEVNSTGGDAGLQFDLDADPWRAINIENPRGRTIFSVRSLGKLKSLGNTELFTESNEPPFDELPLKEFLKMFPEGDYEFDGILTDGQELEGVAVFTHNMPCGPVITSPGEGDTLDPNADIVIVWEPVTNKIDTASDTAECSDSTDIEITGYQVIVDLDGSDPIQRFDIKLPADVTQVTVPAEFIVPNAVYLFEVLAIESGGNQTITEGSFVTSN